jgi:hypothetical protein
MYHKEATGVPNPTKNMPVKKFAGRKINAGDLFNNLGRTDEDLEVYTCDDCVLAPFLKKFLNNDVQELVLSFLGNIDVTFYEEDDNQIINECDYYFESCMGYDVYEYLYGDDFVIDENERMKEQMERHDIFNNKNIT